MAIALFLAIAAARGNPTTFTADLVHGGDSYSGRFDELVERLDYANALEQARFAEIAIATLIDAFEWELDDTSALASPSRVPERAWRSSTRAYVERLRRIGESIPHANQILVMKERDGTVRLLVDREQLMLSAPRLEDQARLERAIAQQMCLFDRCASPRQTIDDRGTPRAAAISSEWNFDHVKVQNLSQGDGLNCVFDDQRHLRLKKVACERLLSEIRSFTEALASLRANGKRVDWNALAINSVGVEEAEKLVYSTDGQFVRMNLPSLIRAESVWRGAVPWVRATVRGRALPHVVQLPEHLVYLSANAKTQHESH